MSATLTRPPSLGQFREEFASHAPLLYWIARKRLLKEDGEAPRDFDNVVANAVGIAWKHYPAIRAKHPEWPVRAAICVAIRRGVCRARHGEALGWSKPHRGYRDALNGKPNELPDDVQAAPPEWRIWFDELLTALQGPAQELAAVLSHGIPHSQARALLRWGAGHYANVLRELSREVRRVLAQRAQ